ncbi:MAG: sugar transferase [Candidatus Pedobacter colombiensis]|uniref:Sugar transferase n=1 Tax=Candidatus Pedobacter colombiensis TaxID=3121371 RepID=A0AAJ5WCU2_9SPHI|nr:sugar transferase [Pedobacter sp.]WEK21281.1 MAG: sugar transferase [Pedobacter sp.]
MRAKRIFDFMVSLIGIMLLMPILLIISLLIWMDSKGDIFYKQTRVGLNKVDFKLLKFRTMFCGAESSGLLTIGDHDKRITRIGFWLRKYKIDELPQLFNILKGDMSFVGPRPEVNKYVELYDSIQQRVLSVKPGITDWASIQFVNEPQLLASSKNPEVFYIENIIPYKIMQNLKYIDHNNLWIDIKIILLTIKSIVLKHK